MKLSEAIREGAKLRPQAHGKWFRDGKSCALGAACEGSGHGDWCESNMLLQWWPELDIEVEHPVKERSSQLLGTILYLNDDANWTREQIADWVEEQGY